MDTIDITPTWSAIMPALLNVIENGTPEGRKLATTELMNLAYQVDKSNKERKQ